MGFLNLGTDLRNTQESMRMAGGLTLSDSWDTAVDFFDRLNQSVQWKEMHGRFLEFIHPLKSDFVLDVGCGPGMLACRVAKKAGSVSGIDISPDMVRRAGENAKKAKVANAEFSIGMAEHLRFRGHSFDRCYSFGVIYLLADDAAGVREMVRVTKAGGIVAVVNPADGMSIAKIDEYVKKNNASGVVKDALYGWLGAALNHRRYSKESAGKLLLSCGLEKIEHLELLDGMAIASKGVKPATERDESGILLLPKRPSKKRKVKRKATKKRKR
jgi:ubiquinone/menaquinone biosynthesis C-methylase UbiE